MGSIVRAIVGLDPVEGPALNAAHSIADGLAAAEIRAALQRAELLLIADLQLPRIELMRVRGLLERHPGVEGGDRLEAAGSLTRTFSGGSARRRPHSALMSVIWRR